jgi:hypothetical protein
MHTRGTNIHSFYLSFGHTTQKENQKTRENNSKIKSFEPNKSKAAAVAADG